MTAPAAEPVSGTRGFLPAVEGLRAAAALGVVLTHVALQTGYTDGVAGRFPIPEVLDDLLEVVDDVALVSEARIREGMRLLHEHAGLVVEPSAALGVAALLEDPERFAGRRVATVICGANVAPADFARWTVSPAAPPG